MHEVVGLDPFRGQVRPDTVVHETAFAFKGGILLTRVRTVSRDDTFLTLQYTR